MTLRFLSSPVRPPTRPSITPCLRVCVTEKSSTGSDVVRPNAAALSIARRIDAVSRSSLAGMQPTLRQVPPMRFFSIRAMLSPADAPYSAAAYPPGPPPMMTTSKFSVIRTTSIATTGSLSLPAPEPGPDRYFQRHSRRPEFADQRVARNNWAAAAAKIAKPQANARRISFRVLMDS
ncbi:unannotated protein [freshwater metagenome]|uniref:Unannotated protein n=1 Tax=freshwater metagenome TaxID=449393 RepID=A0A6J6JWZ0_9ZZZZ